jgi:prophage regulatory protein
MSTSKTPSLSDFIRPKEVAERLSVSLSTIRKWENQGLFPKKVQLGPKAIAWKRTDFDRWLAQRVSS